MVYGKIVFQRTTALELPILTLGPNKGSNFKTYKFIRTMFKNLFLKNYKAAICEITVQTCLDSKKSKFLKL